MEPPHTIVPPYLLVSMRVYHTFLIGPRGLVRAVLAIVEFVTWSPMQSLYFIQCIVGANIDFGGIFRHLFVITQTARTALREFWTCLAWTRRKMCSRCERMYPSLNIPPQIIASPPAPTPSRGGLNQRQDSILSVRQGVCWIVQSTNIVAVLFTECCLMFLYNGMLCTLQNYNDSSDRGATRALLLYLWARFWIPKHDAIEMARHHRCRPRLGSMSYVNMLARSE